MKHETDEVCTICSTSIKDIEYIFPGVDIDDKWVCSDCLKADKGNPLEVILFEIIDGLNEGAYCKDIIKGRVKVFSRTHGLEMDIHRGRGGQIPRA